MYDILNQDTQFMANIDSKTYFIQHFYVYSPNTFAVGSAPMWDRFIALTLENCGPAVKVL